MNTNEEKEREAFETEMQRLFPGCDLRRHQDGSYLWITVESRWEGWKQGRSALRAESEPVGVIRMRNGKWFVHLYAKSKEGKIECGDKLYTAPLTEPKDTGSEI